MTNADQKSIREQMDELVVQGATLCESVKSTQEDMNRILHVLEGNGSPGLIKLVDRHEQGLSNISKLVWVLIGVVATGTGGSALLQTYNTAMNQNAQPTTMPTHR